MSVFQPERRSHCNVKTVFLHICKFFIPQIEILQKLYEIGTNGVFLEDQQYNGNISLLSYVQFVGSKTSNFQYSNFHLFFYDFKGKNY